MQILYGEDTDDNRIANRYVPWSDDPTVLNPARIVSVRISLLLHSVSNGLLTAPAPYTYMGTLTTPTDLRLRKVFSTTISVRNSG